MKTEKCDDMKLNKPHFYSQDK